MTPRALSPSVWTSPQLFPDGIPALAASGVRRIICNRPDGEEPGQPTAAELESVARDAGLTFALIAVSGLPRPDQVTAVAELLADGIPTVMYCRSGMRSAAAWAMAQRLKGVEAGALREAAAAAGYDLGPVPL